MKIDTHKGLIAWFARNPVAANLLLITVMALGILSMGQLRKETFPSIEPNVITVAVTYESGSASQAEEGIALKIEEALEGIAGIKRITSVSNSTGSTVTIEKNSDYVLDQLMTDVQTEVDAIYNLPADAENPVISKQSRQDHAIYVQLSGDIDPSEMYRLGMALKQDLLSRNGVSDIALMGKADPMVAIEVDEPQLQAYDLTFSDVANAVNGESLNMTTSTLRNSEKSIRLKGSSQSYDEQAFAQIPLVQDASGVRVKLGDVARVIDGFEDEPAILTRFDGQRGFAVQLLMDENADIDTLVEQAEIVVAEWQSSGQLPENVKLNTWYDRSTFISERLSLLSSNALLGMGLVFIILSLFLNIRVALWVAMGLPFVFLGTFFFMGEGFLGLTINELTTFGFIMALGIVVDDAIVVGESIYSTRQKEGDSIDSTIRGTIKIAIPTLCGVLTTIAAFLSLAMISGDMGKIFSQFAIVVIVCLLLSIIESKLILPSHLSHINTQNETPRNPFSKAFKFVQGLCGSGLIWFGQTIYLPALRLAVRFRYATMIMLITVFVLITGLLSRGDVKFVFFPDITADVVNANLTMPVETGYGLTQRHALMLENAAREADIQLSNGQGSGIRHIFVNSDSDNSAELVVDLVDSSERNYTATELASQWRQLSGQPEGIQQLKISAAQMMMDNFKLELRGSNGDELEQVGEQLHQIVLATPGVLDTNHNLDRSREQWQVNLNDSGRSLGLTSEDVSRQMLQMFDGETVQRFQRGQDEIKVKVRYPEAQRSSLGQLQYAVIRTPQGEVVPLQAVAELIPGRDLDEITRINGKRSVYISASVDKSMISPQQLQSLLEQDALETIKSQYPSISFNFAGEAEQQAETMGSMMILGVGVLLVIYAMLAVPLKSYIQPVLIMMSIPFALVGAILGHWINDITLSLMSLFGILALSGVIVNDSLLLVSTFNALRANGVPFTEAVEQTCLSRLRPILLTSTTTFAGLSPLLLETSIQAQFLIPAAAALGYGILFGTIIILLMMPALLRIQQDVIELYNKVILNLTGRA